MSKQYTVQAPDGKTITLEGPDNATQEEVIAQAQALYKPNAVKAPPAPPEPTATQTTTYQQMMGAAPPELLERVKGAARPVAKAGMSMLQWMDYLRGKQVRPTPLSLEPSPDPNQQIGEMVGKAALTTLPSVATAGASLPVQTAVGAAVGGAEGGVPGAVIGGAAPAVMQGVIKGAQYLADKADAAKIFNKVAGVPAGRKGVETSLATGEIKTNPGNAAVRAMKGESPLGRLSEAVFAKPTPELQTKIYGELQDAGKDLGAHLAASKNVLDVSKSVDVSLPKVQVAMEEAGITADKLKALTPTEAHLFRSKLGDLIPSSSWGAESPNPMTEQLKDVYFGVGDTIKKGVDGIASFDKRWQEDFLYAKALKHQLDLIAAGKMNPSSMAGRFVRKTAIGAGGVGTVYEAIRRAAK